MSCTNLNFSDTLLKMGLVSFLMILIGHSVNMYLELSGWLLLSYTVSLKYVFGGVYNFNWSQFWSIGIIPLILGGVCVYSRRNPHHKKEILILSTLLWLILARQLSYDDLGIWREDRAQLLYSGAILISLSTYLTTLDRKKDLEHSLNVFGWLLMIGGISQGCRQLA